MPASAPISEVLVVMPKRDDQLGADDGTDHAKRRDQGKRAQTEKRRMHAISSGGWDLICYRL